MNEAGGKRSVVLRCSDRKSEQHVQLGPGMDNREDADMFLCLMTGGHYGESPWPFRKTEPGDGSLIGNSLCCQAQLEGEVIEHGTEA